MAKEDFNQWIEPVVFAGFLVISVVFEWVMHKIEHALEHRGRPGLLALLHTLKNEILLYGLLSILLSLVVKPLGAICVPKKDGIYEVNAAYINKTAYDAKAASSRNLLHAVGDLFDSPKAVQLESSYLAVNATNSTVFIMDDKSTKVFSNPVTNCLLQGKVQLMPYKVAYNIHVLIFGIAIAHITVILLTVMISLTKIRRWRKWAAEPQEKVERIEGRVVKSLGRNCCFHWFWSVFNLYTLGVSKPVFLGVRRFFLEQLKAVGKTDDLVKFPFFDFLRFTMEHYLAHLAHLDVVVWIFAIIIIAVPQDFQKPVLYGFGIISILLLMLCGTKMQSNVVHLASRAQVLYHQEILSCEVGKIQEECNAADGAVKDISGRMSHGSLEVDQPRGIKRAGHQVGMEHHQLKGRLAAMGTTKELFWFSKPRLLLVLYKIAFFQAAFACAYLIYRALMRADKEELLGTNALDTWSEKVGPFFAKDPKDGSKKAITLGDIGLILLLVLEVVLIIHSAWMVLPTYALCMTTSKEAQDYIRLFLQNMRNHDELHEPAEQYITEQLHTTHTMERLQSRELEEEGIISSKGGHGLRRTTAAHDGLPTHNTASHV